MKYVLQNAIFYEGKANPNAILGKILGSEPALRKNPDKVRKEIEEVAKKVNSMDLAKQKEELKKIDPEMLVKEEKEQEELPPLKGAVEGKVVTRFAPSPTGPLMIYHLLRAVYLNYLYAQKYNGKFIVRIEDTDPGNIKREFYEWIKEDLKNSGVKWDELFHQSDHMDLYYKNAEKLIQKNDVYACFCNPDQFKKLKNKKMNCPCRDEGKTKFHWDKAVRGDYAEGEMIFRLKTSMQDPNPAIRDPALFRINKKHHPFKTIKYKLWPLYNFANTIDDHEMGVTHVFRGKEHEHNTTIQKMIYEKLGWKMPFVINFGMIYLPGVKLHTRDIKQMIAEEKFTGWDDVRLPTIRSIIRRGFQPEAIRELAISSGLTKTDINVSWEKFETLNRKIIDKKANRYMVVKSPVRLVIKDAPSMNQVREKIHPESEKTRIIPVNLKEIYIEKEDYIRLKDRDFRLKGLGNIRVTGKTGRYLGNEIYKDMHKIQWVSKPHAEVIILKGDDVIHGIGEPGLKKLHPGQIIQMERIGFGKVDARTDNEIVIIFAHR